MKPNWKTLFLLTTCCTLGLMTSVRAQVSSDGTLSTTVSNPDNLNFTINNGNRVGGNLFHSFREFSVPNGGSAVFQNGLDVQNIINRVTGGSLSQINGLIQTQGSANLFLLNPAGIFFGPNARLNVGGSFFATTADSFLFDNGFEFSATNPQAPPLLTVNIPVGLRFRDNPGNITNRSVVQDNTGFGIGLQVNPGNSLALVGGNVSLEQGGRLTAAGGRIELGGLAGAGTVGLQTTGNTFRLNFPANGLSNVSLADDARVAVRSNGGGDIAVNANIFTATNGGRLVGGIEGMATTKGGDITVNSNEFNISGVGQSGLGAGIIQQVVDDASGNAGNIVVNTKSFNASSGGQFQNRVLPGGTGNAGDISITGNSISFTNAQINSSTSGKGNAGNISLQAGDAIALTDSSTITTNVQEGGSGIGGNIDIRGRSLTVTDGSQIQAGIFRQVDDILGGNGTGGTIKINASDFVNISGFSFSNGLSGIFTPAETGSTGSAGSIDITTGAFRLANFAIIIAGTANGNNGGNITINAKTFEVTNGQLETSLSGQAEAVRLISAGNIKLNVSDSVALKDGSRLSSSSSGQGNAGNVTISAGGAVSLENGSRIFSDIESTGKGNAGDVNIQAGSLSLKDGSTVGVSTFGQGNAGSAIIKVQNTFSADGVGTDGFSSGIFSTVEKDAVGNGGGIDITTGTLSLTNGAIINASTFATGDAGRIKIQATDTIKASGVGSNDVTSSIRSRVGDNAVGNAGGIDIKTKNLFFSNGAQITASTLGTGDAGSVKIQASDISFDGVGSTGFSSGIFSTVATNGRGNAGGIDITTGTLSLTNGAIINASTFARGNAGTVKIQASDTIKASGVGSNRVTSSIRNNVQNNATGNGGGIDITTKNLSFTNGAQIIANTSGNGNAGTVKIQASDISFDGVFNGFTSGIFSTVEGNAIGNGGGIDITTGTLSLTNGAIINASTFARGNAGIVKILARDISLNGAGSDISSSVEVGATGKGGDIDIQTRTLFLTNGAEILALTREDGIAGNIRVNATDSIFLNGVAPTVLQNGRAGGFSSGLFSNSDEANSGAGGQIWVETPNLRILDGAVISARSRSAANAGSITVNSQNLELRGGGQILATAFNGGNAGNIDITSDRITISGTDPTYFARFNQVAQQFGRDIAEQRIDPVAPESGIFVNSTGTGQGGNLSITGNTLTLDRGIISASTQSADGGNINLRLRNFVRLQNESLIEANARGEGGGNGGNITIDTPFIVAFPQNNDIIANAVSGSGGRVRTNASLFGIIPRTRADLQRLGVPGLNPRNLSTSDITAFSEQSSNFGGNVQVTSPDVDPSRGLVELPETVSDRTQQIAQNPCQQGVGNEFFVTGRGGLPTNPNQTLNSDNVRVDLLQPVASSGNSRSATKTKPATTVIATRVPAQGWIFNDKGQVVLTAYDPTNTGSQRSFSTAAACPAR